MKHSKLAAFVTACALSACSGAAPTVLPAVQNLPLRQVVTPNRSQHQKMATVSFSITWPSRRRHRLHGRFISPSTKSVVLQEGSGKNAIVGIANYNGKTTSQLKIQAPVGRDSFVVALYDRPQKASSGPVGNELGQGEIVQRVRADRVNNLHVVVDGVVSSINLALDPSATMAEITGAAGTQTLTLVGDLPAAIVLTPVDADGNAIVAPGVVPSVSLKVPVNQGATVSVAQSTSDQDAYVVSATGPSPNATFGLIAKAKDGQGNIAQTNVAGVQSQAIYVAYQNGAGSKIAVYDKSGKPLTLAAGAFAGVTQPVGMSYDADDHLLFVADKTGKLLAFDGAGNPSPAFTPKTVAGINSVNYFNAQIVNFPQYAISNPQRVIVGGSGGVVEFDAETGAQLAQTTLPFTPTAVTGFMDEVGYSASGWLVMVGDPAGSVDPYDLVTLSPYSGNVSALNGGEKPTGFAAYLEPTAFGYSGDFCIDGKSVFPSSGNDSSCLYTVTGSASTIVRLGNVPGYSTPFGQYGVQGEYDQGRGSGVLSAIAVDQLNYNLDVTSSDTNTVHEYAVTDEYNYQHQTDNFGLGLSGSFVTPASLGLSSPNAIAVEW